MVTPGATSAWRASWVRYRTAPDAAIASSSPGVFGIGPRGRCGAVATGYSGPAGAGGMCATI